MASESEDLLDIKQAAKLLNVSETSLRRWTNSGALPAYRIGRRRERRFRRTDLFAFMGAPSSDEAQSPPDASTAGSASASDTTQTAQNQRNHFCGFYGTAAGRARLAAAFLLDGVGRRDREVKFLLVEPKAQGPLVKTVQKLARSKRADLNGENFVATVYRDSVKAQLDFWERSFDRVLATGTTSLRVVGDTCGFAHRTSFAALAKYEAEYERRIAQRYPVLTLCLYDARLLSGWEAVRALKAHGDTFCRPVETLFE